MIDFSRLCDFYEDKKTKELSCYCRREAGRGIYRQGGIWFVNNAAPIRRKIRDIF